MKTLFSILTALALAIPASAQQAGVYFSNLLTGGTNGVVHGATNTYTTLTTNTFAGVSQVVNFPVEIREVRDHSTIGIELNYSDANPAATNAAIVLLISQSNDNGNTFETTPSIILTNQFPTALQQSVNGLNGFTNRCALFTIGNLSATHIAVAIGNTGTTAAQDVTNLALVFCIPQGRAYEEPARR